MSRNTLFILEDEVFKNFVTLLSFFTVIKSEFFQTMKQKLSKQPLQNLEGPSICRSKTSLSATILAGNTKCILLCILYFNCFLIINKLLKPKLPYERIQ